MFDLSTIQHMNFTAEAIHESRNAKVCGVKERHAINGKPLRVMTESIQIMIDYGIAGDMTAEEYVEYLETTK